MTANVECANPDNKHVPIRHIMVCQRRITKDLPLTIWPVPRLKPWIASEFILIGSSAAASRPRLDSIAKGEGELQLHHDDIGVIRGKVLVVPHHEEANLAAERFVKDVRQRAVEIGDNSPRGTVCGANEFTGDFEAMIAKARQQGVVPIEAGFLLYRSGEFRLSFSRNDDLVAVAEGAGGGTAIDFDDGGFIADLAKQMYYFVKDISHRHYHHDRSSDNLLPIFESAGLDDEAWRRHTLWALARAVLETRRRNRLAGHKSALGILAYAEAFQQQLARVKRTPEIESFERSEVGALYDFSHTRASLDATIEELSFNKSFWTQLHTLLVGSALAGAALWIAAYQVQGALCTGMLGCVAPSPPNWVRTGLAQIISRPTIPIAIFVVAGLLYFEFARRSLENIRGVRHASWFVGSWAGAAGASFSRWLRKKHPVWGDTLGAVVAWLIALAAVLATGYLAAGLFGLAPFPHWAKIETWLGWIEGILGAATAATAAGTQIGFAALTLIPSPLLGPGRRD